MASVVARNYDTSGMTSLSCRSTADSRASRRRSNSSSIINSGGGRHVHAHAALAMTDPPTPMSAPGDLDEGTDLLSPSSTASTIPPYWHTPQTNHHKRSSSNMSADSLPAGAITLQDNEEDDDNDRNNACWAKSVEIVDYTVVNGSATNIGAFVVWIIKVETLTGSYMHIRKRYSEFDDFRNNLIQSFPDFEAALPPLPPKSVISKFRPRFLDKRRAGLQYFLHCVLLNPEFSGSPVLKDFLFS